MKRVILVYGGKSVEHEVSCRSALQVYNQLLACGYSVIPIGIAKDGILYLQDRLIIDDNSLGIEESPACSVMIAPGDGFYVSGRKICGDIVFPVTHGTFGEDGCLQGMLRLIPLPFIGSNQISSGISMKKSFTKAILAYYNLPIVPFLHLDRLDIDLSNPEVLFQNPKLRAFLSTHGYPLFVKPDIGGSSIGISRVNRKEELLSALQLALSYDNSILIESYIDAEEIECGVIGSGSDIVVTLPGSIHPTGGFYSYHEKYLDGSLRVSIPPDIDSDTVSKIQDLSRTVYRLIDCSGFARIDFFYVRDEDLILINEINTIPGLTPTSLFMELCFASHIQWDIFFSLLIADAERQYYQQRSLLFTAETTTEV